MKAFVLASVGIGSVMVAAAIAGCGASAQNSWTPADTTETDDNAHLQLHMEEMIGPDATTCNAAEVRADERAAFCDSVDQLARHGQPVPDSGIHCKKR